jgi:thiosulfate dehydrogenase (quinone) large subunit
VRTNVAGPNVTDNVAAMETLVAQDTGNGHEPAVSTTAPFGRSATAARYLLAGVRLALGWIFLWGFLDKAFGLGHETTSARSWLNGGSPTKGFWAPPRRAHSPASTGRSRLSGVVDVLFMTALLAIGGALILGIALRLAAATGVLLTVMMWTVVLPRPATRLWMTISSTPPY